MNEEAPAPLRYHEEGNVHLDFHGAVNTTIDFIIARYGIGAMHEIFRRVGRDVYSDIRHHLITGDSGELVKHWRHFFDREGAEYDISIGPDEIVLTVRHCTAWHHVHKLVGTVSPHFCEQTIVTNEALAEGTPFAIETSVTGPGTCRQVIRRRP
jgi:hypothetical protein